MSGLAGKKNLPAQFHTVSGLLFHGPAYFACWPLGGSCAEACTIREQSAARQGSKVGSKAQGNGKGPITVSNCIADLRGVKPLRITVLQSSAAELSQDFEK